MRRILPVTLFLLACMAPPAMAIVQKTGLKAAMAKGLVELAALSSGDIYDGKALKLKLKNKTKDPMQVTLDPALIFRPSDTSYQDLVIVGEQMLVLAPNGENSIAVQTFCAKSYASAPGSGLSYSFLKQGDSAMIQVLHFIKQNNLYTGAGQHAVWVLTNDLSLDGIYDPDHPEISNKLLALMVKLTGKPVPGYFKSYKLNTVAGEPAFIPRVLKMYANFEWRLEAAKTLTLGIYNSQGHMIQPVMENKELAKGGYKVRVEFEAENVKQGTYFIRLMDGITVMKELAVVVD